MNKKSLKILGREYLDWDDFMSTVNFFRFNPHSIPGIVQLLCKMGRHDYLPTEILGHNYVMLECFYCGKEKACTFKPNI
jgi:hypothetical protein